MSNPKQYVSVTQVLAKYQDFSRVSEDRLALACERGTAVHNFCAAHAQGLWIPKPREYAGYCESFQRWFDAYVDEVLLVEERLIDETLGFLGHPDLVARLKHDKHPTVIDYKTPVALNPIWAAQVAAYKHLTKIRLPELRWPDRCASLRLDPDGRLAKFKDYADSARDLQAFLNALTAHKYFLGGD